MFATTVAAGSADAIPFGLAKLIAGVAFSLWLIWVRTDRTSSVRG